MTEKNNFPDFTTYPKTFEKYKWYKPILVFIVGLILYLIFLSIIFAIFGKIYGNNAINNALLSGYESMDTSDMASYVSYLPIAMFIPTLYIASKIVKDRPFSSYGSSRGGWNWKLYFKSLTIPFVVFLIYGIITLLLSGGKRVPTQMTALGFIICLFLVPLQCIGEEYVNRGLFMQTFGSWFNIPILAVILQSIFFTTLHGYNPTGMLGIFITGIVYGLLAWKTYGIETSSALHSINNLYIMTYVSLGFENATSNVSISGFLISITLTIVSAALLYYISNRYGWIEENTQ